jgi:hypothetical protein
MKVTCTFQSFPVVKKGLCINSLISVLNIWQDQRRHHNRAGSNEFDSQRESSDTDKSDNPDSKPTSQRRN